MENMKPSGIEWIGDIPEHWKVKRIKHCCNLGSGTTPESSNYDFYDGEINWIQSGDLYGTDVIEETEKTITDLAIKTYSTLKVYDADYVIVAMYGASVGNVAISRINACVNQACCVLSVGNHEDVRYLYYWLVNCKDDLILQSVGGGQPNISQQKIKNEHMLSVPIEEQTLIANFLDEQCGKINNIIADIEKQIEILGQYKRSLITETVTRGLDKSVPMKDSGIEWIGEIPEHWDVKRMQDVGEYKKGPFGSSITLDMFVDKDDTTIKIYEQKNAIHADAELGWYYISNQDYKALKDFEVFSGDIIVSCAGTIGKCYIMPENIEKGIINQALMRISLHNDIDKQYFLYLFDVALEYMTDKYSNGSAIKNIPPFSVLKKQNIPYPGPAEQKLISTYLDEKCSTLDSFLNLKEEQLAKIRQHKKSLIYEYVTGKKRVKGAIQNGN